MQKADIGEKEKTRKKVKSKLLNNLGLKLISIAIAIVLWFAIVIITNPKASRVFTDIPVRLINTELLENENKVYEVLDKSDVIRVTVEVARDDLNLLRASDIVAEADMSNLTAINTVAINLSVANNDVNVVSISGNHDVVRLNVEDKVSRWFNVQTNTTGDVAEGYMVAGVNRDPTRLQVSGPQSIIDNISYVGVDVDLTNAATNQTVNVRPQLYDADGNRLDDSRVSMNSTSVHVEIQVLATKEVAVEIRPKGVPAEGYLDTGVVVCEPSRVELAGTPAALSGVNKIIIPEDELDMTGATGNLENTINIKKYLPENVSLADNGFDGRITATVYIEPIVERILSIPQSNIDVLGMPEEIEWEFAQGSGSYELRISGLEKALSAVDQNTLRGTVNINDWMRESDIEELTAGTYRIPVNVELPDDVVMENRILIQVTVLELEEEE